MRLIVGLALVLSAASAEAGELRQLHVVNGADGAQVVFDLDDAANSKVFVFTLPNPERVVVDFTAVRRGADLKFETPPQGMVHRLRSGPRDNSSGLRVVLDLDAAVRVKSSGLQAAGGDGYHLTLDLSPKSGSPRPVVAQAAPASVATEEGGAAAAQPAAPREQVAASVPAAAAPPVPAAEQPAPEPVPPPAPVQSPEPVQAAAPAPAAPPVRTPAPARSAAPARVVAASEAAMPAAADAGALGKALTPIGAERAGNADGVIPAWTGGHPQSGPLSGEFPHDSVIDADQPLFTITHDNYAKYADKLTEGHKALLKRFADYKMDVYPTHRPVSFPDFIYKATAANTAACKLNGTDEPDGCSLGFPFPIPQSGAEVIWNHKLKWRGDSVQRYNNQLIVQPNGEYQLTKILEQLKFYYANDRSPVPLKGGQGEFLRYLSQTLQPPRVAGTLVLVHDMPGTGDAGRASWIYSPGLKRVRRAPTVQYDNPSEGTDGNQFYDQVDMFNGALDRYNWKLVGKKEFYLPYDSNRIAGNGIKYADIVRPHHLNQDLPRYELHRYWVVEANLKPGINHTFKTRRFYVDEDSWDIEAVDDYDNRDQLYKFQEGHLICASDIQTATTVPEVIYDFFSGRYFITAAYNEDKPNNLSLNWPDDYFSATSVQKLTTK